MEGPPLGPGGEDITWPDQVAPRGRKASSTRKIKPQTPNLKKDIPFMTHVFFIEIAVETRLQKVLRGITRAAKWFVSRVRRIPRTAPYQRFQLPHGGLY